MHTIVKIILLLTFAILIFLGFTLTVVGESRKDYNLIYVGIVLFIVGTLFGLVVVIIKCCINAGVCCNTQYDLV